MVKDKCGLVHLTQDQKHLVVNKLLVLCEVTAHMLLQLVTNLRIKNIPTKNSETSPH